MQTLRGGFRPIISLRPSSMAFSSRVMRAITVDPELKDAKAEDLRIDETVPIPTITDPDNEYLLKVQATAVNRADILQRQGKYPPPKGASTIIGLECAGTVVDPETL